MPPYKRLYWLFYVLWRAPIPLGRTYRSVPSCRSLLFRAYARVLSPIQFRKQCIPVLPCKSLPCREYALSRHLRWHGIRYNTVLPYRLPPCREYAPWQAPIRCDKPYRFWHRYSSLSWAYDLLPAPIQYGIPYIFAHRYRLPPRRAYVRVPPSIPRGIRYNAGFRCSLPPDRAYVLLQERSPARSAFPYRASSADLPSVLFRYRSAVPQDRQRRCGRIPPFPLRSYRR